MPSGDAQGVRPRQRFLVVLFGLPVATVLAVSKGYGNDVSDKVSHLLKSLWDKLFKTQFFPFCASHTTKKLNFGK